jgi:acyl dehydratase
MGLYFEEFTDDLRVVTRGRTVGEGDITLFSGLSGDFNPLHVDAEYCAGTSFDATTMGLLDLQWSFAGPVRIGDTVHAVVTTADRKPSRKPDRGVVTLRLDVFNQRGEQVQTGHMKLLMKRREAGLA